MRIGKTCVIKNLSRREQLSSSQDNAAAAACLFYVYMLANVSLQIIQVVQMVTYAFDDLYVERELITLSVGFKKLTLDCPTFFQFYYYFFFHYFLQLLCGF